MQDQFSLVALLKEVIKVISEQCSMAPAASSTIVAARAPFEMRIHFESIDRRSVEAASSFLRGVIERGLEGSGIRIASGPSVLAPIFEKWTTLSSPFVHKTARTQFERRTHRQTTAVQGFNSSQIRASLLWYLKRSLPADVIMEAEFVDRATIDDNSSPQQRQQ